MVKKKKDDGASAKGKKKKETANPEATAHESIVERIRHNIDPEEEKALAIKGRQLLINAWKARNQLYGELFGKYSWVSPLTYAPPSPEIDLDRRIEPDPGGSSDPGDPNLADQHLSVLAYGPDPLRP